MYLEPSDLETLRVYLNDDDDLAWLVSAGAPGHWKAVQRLASLEEGAYKLWHAKSGPLPLPARGVLLDAALVMDPYQGWEDTIRGANAAVPYFGSSHWGVIDLELRIRGSTRPGRQTRTSIGLSTFQWIGNLERFIRGPATPETVRRWRELRKWVARMSVKVALVENGNPKRTGFAFPGAAQAIQAGVPRDANPHPPRRIQPNTDLHDWLTDQIRASRGDAPES